MYVVWEKALPQQQLTWHVLIYDEINSILQKMNGKPDVFDQTYRIAFFSVHGFVRGHSDLDCEIVSKNYFQTSFLGQEHLVVWYL